MLRGQISTACAPTAAPVAPALAGSLSIVGILRIPEVRICCFVAFAVGGTLYSVGSLWNEFISRVAWEQSEDQRAFLMTAYWLVRYSNFQTF
jgi:hypothetical protein